MGLLMENRGRVLVLVIITLFLFATHLSTYTVEATFFTQVEIELLEESVEVDVSPGSDKRAYLKGTVTCKNR